MPARGRVERSLLVCLALLGAAPAWGGPAPCPRPPRILAAAGPGRLGPGARTQRSVPFELSAPALVWAEASGLSGLDGEDRDAAPEVFLDDDYLGPLLPDHGAVWRSPMAVRLSAGSHQLLLRCAQPGGFGPLLRWSALRVLTRRPCAGKAPRKRGPRVAGPAPAPPRPAPERPAVPLRTACGPAPVGTGWPARLDGRDLLVSSSHGRAAFSGTVAVLGFGQAWAARLKIPSGPGARPVPLVAHIEQDGSGHACFLVAVDPEAPPHATVTSLGYRPDAWEPFLVWLCPGHLTVRFAHEADMDLPYGAPRAALSLGALGLTLSFAPAR